jgi:hypothetical protein
MLFQYAPYIYAFLLGIAFILLLISKPRFTLSNYFIAIFIIYHGPAFFIYHYFSKHSYEFNKIALALSLALIFFYVGKFTIYAFTGQSLNYNRWYHESIQPININRDILFFIALVSLTVMLIFISFYGGLTNLSIGWQMDYTDIRAGLYADLRTKHLIVEEAGAIGSIFSYITSAITPFISFVLIGYAVKNTRNRAFYALLAFAIGFAILVLLSKLSTLHKSPGVYYIIQLAIFGYLLHNKPLNLSNLIKVSLLGLFLLIIIYLKVSGAQSPVEALSLILSRITIVPNLCLNNFFDKYPDIYPHTWGLNIRILHSLFGEGTYVPAHELITFIGNSNAIYVADAWVDFAWAGVIVYSWLLGMILMYLDLSIASSKNILSIALFVGLLYSVQSLINTSLISCFITFGLLSLPVLSKILGLNLSIWHAPLHNPPTHRRDLIRLR